MPFLALPMFCVWNFLYTWRQIRNEAVLFASRSGAFWVKKHRFVHRKAPLRSVDSVNALIFSWL